MRSIAALILLASAAAEQCVFQRNPDSCPGENAPCNQDVLCKSGLYCKVDSLGTGSATYSGRCSKGPVLDDIYGKPCSVGNDYRACQFDNPLALSPRTAPNNLRCIQAFAGDPAGTCRLGPQKHGDGCNENGECASGHCLKELNICQGADEGETCVPDYPDPCQPNHYCAPAAGAPKGGYCVKAVSAGRACNWPTACEKGTFCAGPDNANRRCLPMFSVPTGQNTTIGPYMCASANGVIVELGASLPTSIYQCVDANSTRVGQACDSRQKAPLGYECKCASDGQNRLRTVRALGLGGRSEAWKALYTCLRGAEGPMGESCEFDSLDMEQVRYGSCAFYACYPYYLKLVNATGGRVFSPPLDVFEPTAPCELEAAKSYYQEVANTKCISIPHMDNWKCAVLAPPVSLSVQDTAGVIAFIFLAIWGGYWYHVYKFRHINKQKICGR